MYRFYSIAATLLIAANTLAMPVHYAIGHGHELAHLDSQGNLLGVLDTDCSEAGRETTAAPEVFDASCCGTPHHHDAHQHGAADQGYLSLRSGSNFFAAWIQLPTRNAFAVALSTQPVGANHVGAYHSPTLAQPTLRGPPHV